MSHLFAVNYLSVIIATIGAFVIGAVYYNVFGKPWMEAHNLEGKIENKVPVKPMIISLIAEFVMAMMLYGIMSHLPRFSIHSGLTSGFLIWLGFVVTTLATNYAYTLKGRNAFVIDAGHWLLVLLLQGAVIGYFGK